MRTGPAVMLSVAIAVAVALLIGLGSYWAVRRVAPNGFPQRIDVELPQRTGAPALGRADADAHVQAILAPVLSKLQASRRPVLNLQQQPMARDEPLASKIGGGAYWTGERPYPRDAAGQPMFVLAQIDLAALRLRGYPQRGLLQFFVAADDFYGANLDALSAHDPMRTLAEQKNFRVVYWPQPAATAAIAPPPAALQANDALPFDPGKPYRLTGSPDEDAIGGSDAHVEAVLGTAPDALVEAYAARHPGLPRDALDDAVHESLQRFGSKLGGYPDFTQQDPRPASDRSVLLLQLDSTDAMMWGDSGIANFFIDPDDLARADFSRVAYHWDCY